MTKQYNLETNMTIQRQVMKIIAEKNSIRIEDISSEKSFSELGSDSLTSMEMIMAMENEFEPQQRSINILHGWLRRSCGWDCTKRPSLVVHQQLSSNSWNRSRLALLDLETYQQFPREPREAMLDPRLNSMTARVHGNRHGTQVCQIQNGPYDDITHGGESRPLGHYVCQDQHCVNKHQNKGANAQGNILESA